MLILEIKLPIADDAHLLYTIIMYHKLPTYIYIYTLKIRPLDFILNIFLFAGKLFSSIFTLLCLYIYLIVGMRIIGLYVCYGWA